MTNIAVSAQRPCEQTKQLYVGGLSVGGGAPIRVQSMTNTDTSDHVATLEQIGRLHDAGCELIRCAVPHREVLTGFEAICKSSPIPVIADIHFDHRLALAAIDRGCSALRINPGNIGSWDRVDAIIDEAGAAGIPIRIGVNAGSLDSKIAEDTSLSLAEKLVRSAEIFVEHFSDRGFCNVALSAKAHDVATTIDSYRLLSRKLPHIPLHLGITEAGTAFQGTIKSSVGLGVLLHEGIGDTIRVSLTADPVEEIRVGFEILAALGLRRLHPELISCPTCGRTEVDLISIAHEVEDALQTITKPITVAVMGCVVNGPGEAAAADIGVACGKGRGAIFVRGEIICTVAEKDIVPTLIQEIHDRF